MLAGEEIRWNALVKGMPTIRPNANRPCSHQMDLVQRRIESTDSGAIALARGIADRSPDGGGKDRLAPGDAVELDVLALGADVEPLAEAHFVEQLDFGLQAVGGGHLGLDVKPLGDPQPLDHEPRDDDQQQRPRNGKPSQRLTFFRDACKRLGRTR